MDGKLDAPKSLLPEVHRLYFEPQYPEFSARTMWSLSNAFTSAFKKRSRPAVQGNGQAGRLSHPIAGITTLAPFGVAIILNGAGLFEHEERLGDPDPSSDFP